MTQIESIAESLIGIPYKHGGRDRSGVDCSGLCYIFYQAAGIDFPIGDGQDYSVDWHKTDPRRYQQALEKIGSPAPLSYFKPLDLVYFFVGGIVTHSGVMADSSRFIHIRENQKVCIERLSAAWLRRLAGVRRLA